MKGSTVSKYLQAQAPHFGTGSHLKKIKYNTKKHSQKLIGGKEYSVKDERRGEKETDERGEEEIGANGKVGQNEWTRLRTKTNKRNSTLQTINKNSSFLILRDERRVINEWENLILGICMQCHLMRASGRMMEIKELEWTDVYQ